MSDTNDDPEIPPGTHLVAGMGIAAVTDEPDYCAPVIGSTTSPGVFAWGSHTTGVGYGATREESIRAAVADYNTKKVRDA